MKLTRKVFTFREQDDAWAFVNTASTAGYTLFESVSPALNESLGYVIHVPRDYLNDLSHLRKIADHVKESKLNKFIAQESYNFDKFMDGICDRENVAILQENENPMRERARRHQELPQNRIKF